MFIVPNHKKKKINMWIHVYPNSKTNFNSKNSGNRSFSYETKASISFIPTRRMCSWRPIMKRKEIIIWIHVYLNSKMNLNSKKGRKGSFSYETKALISFIPMRRICLWCPMMKGIRIIMSIHVYRNWKMNFDSKNSKKEVFLMKPKH